MKLITIDRQWSNAIGIDEDGKPGYICCVAVWKSGSTKEETPDDELIFTHKKEAIAWAKRTHPDARISYCTDVKRVTSAAILSDPQLEALRLLAISGDWTRLADVNGICKGCFTVQYMVGRSLSKKGLVEKQNAQIRINERGRKVLEICNDKTQHHL